MTYDAMNMIAVFMFMFCNIVPHGLYHFPIYFLDSLLKEDAVGWIHSLDRRTILNISYPV